MSLAILVRRDGEGVERARQVRPARRGWPAPRTCWARSRTAGRSASAIAVGKGLAEARRRVEPGADRGAALRQPASAAASARIDARAMPAAQVCAHSRRIPAPSVSGVASCRWVRPILTMSRPRRRLAGERALQRVAAPGSSRAVSRQRRRDMHRGREAVVRRLGPMLTWSLGCTGALPPRVAGQQSRWRVRRSPR